MSILDVQDLKVSYTTAHAVVNVVRGVSFAVDSGEAVGLVGESGCGKSSCARSLVRLTPATGRVAVDGCDWLGMSLKELRPHRSRMQMIFQNPYGSLDPRMTVQRAILEAVMLAPSEQVDTGNMGMSRAPYESPADAQQTAPLDRVKVLLRQVGLDESALCRYPHQFSGGQRQRVAIARALALNPKILLADEPVSALDVSIQAQIVNLLDTLKQEKQLGILFISHDLAVVRHVCDRILVMYLGRIVESGPALLVLDSPLHPYTRALAAAIPIIDRPYSMVPALGEVPSVAHPPAGCAFHPRCPYAIPACSEQIPALQDDPHDPLRKAACIRIGQI